MDRTYMTSRHIKNQHPSLFWIVWHFLSCSAENTLPGQHQDKRTIENEDIKQKPEDIVSHQDIVSS